MLSLLTSTENVCQDQCPRKYKKHHREYMVAIGSGLDLGLQSWSLLWTPQII